jgi:hypothetical protein
MKIPKVETLIIIAFFGIVALWAVSKCSSKRIDYAKKAKYTDEEADERPQKKDTTRVPIAAAPTQTLPVPSSSPPATQQPTTQNPAPTTTPGVAPKRPSLTPQNTAPPASTETSTSANKYSTLFVTIDGLKVRKEPSLKGALVTKLDLYQQVYFLNQKTEKTETISLGTEKVTDHWVKIRTKEGKEGWVFGAGVHYYKMKRKGTLE